MSDLVVIPGAARYELDLPQSPYTEDPKVFNELLSASAFLPRLQLCNGTSTVVQEGKIGVGKYALIRSKDQVEDLTNQVDIMPFSWRFRAMQIMPDKTLLSYFNPKSPEFQRVQAASAEQNSGAMYGAEFLIWVPAAKCFATLYLNNATSRQEAPNLKGFLKEKKAVTLKSQFIVGKKHKWYGPVVVPCSTPFDLPTEEDILTQATKFASPKESEVEKADSSTTERVL